MTFYKRHLPHWQPNEAEYFVTFRLADSLPKEVIERIQRNRHLITEEDEEQTNSPDHLPKKHLRKKLVDSDKKPEIREIIDQEIFIKYEALLDKAETGPTWLSDDRIANIVRESLHYWDRKNYDLYSYCIMPNHVHLLFKLIDQSDETSDYEYPVTKIMHSIKSFTASKSNKLLKRKGAFWQTESYDRVIRDSKELENVLFYILHNPVGAGLVSHWKEWKFSYCKKEFLNALG